MCRHQLPVWQQLHEEFGDSIGLTNVAVDFQGAEVARPWVEAARVTFRSLVDRQGDLLRLMGLTFVPIAAFLDAQGNLVEPPTPIEIRRPQMREAIVAWVDGKQDKPGFDQDVRRTESTIAYLEARAFVRLANLAVTDGRKTDSAAHLKEALRRDPENWLIRKQIWAIEQPERFYQGDIDLEWQKGQIEEGV